MNITGLKKKKAYYVILIKEIEALENPSGNERKELKYLRNKVKWLNTLIKLKG